MLDPLDRTATTDVPGRPAAVRSRVTVLRKSCASFINASSLSRGCASVRIIHAVEEPSKMEVTSGPSGVKELASSSGPQAHATADSSW